MYIHNPHLRVFILDPVTHENPKYCGTTGIFRVMFEKDIAKVILKEILSVHYGLKNDFKDGVQIVVTHTKIGDPSIFEDAKPYFVFTNCLLVRSWIPHLVPTRSKDSSAVTYWIEVESRNWDWLELDE